MTTTKNRSIGIGTLLGCLGALQACGGEGAGGPEASVQAKTGDTYWTREVHAYPYLGDDGRMVCERRTHLASNGELEVDQEEYDFALMNDLLEGRAELEPEVRAGLHAAGLTSVVTCDDARLFTTLRRDLERSLEMAAPAVRTEPQADAADEQEDKVAVGVQDTNWGYSVRFREKGHGWCSGVLIGANALITAQHCVASWLDGYIYVDYGLNTTLPCISSTCETYHPDTWTATTPSFANAKIYRYPGWTGTQDIQRDLALVVHYDFYSLRPKNWQTPANTSDHWVRMLQSQVYPDDQFWIFGYGYAANTGANSGISRVSNYQVSIESNTTSYFTVDVVQNGTRACKGDSGGGAINDQRFTNDVVLGLSSGFDGRDGQCPEPGATQFWVGLYQKTSWIKDTLAAIGAVNCGWHDGANGNYMRCW